MTQQELAVFLCEYENRERIYKDSSRICQETKSFEVFQRRYDCIVEYVRWSFDVKKNGAPITITHNEEDAVNEVLRFYNFHCARISALIADGAKTAKTKKKAFDAIFAILPTLKDAENKTEVQQKINNILQQINT